MARNEEKERQDLNGEKAVHDFLLQHFYDQVSNFCECHDKKTQLKGIDTTFTLNDIDYRCDEKAALDFTNGQKGRKLNTFCLELSFLNRKDELMEGWFLNDKMDNNSYLFVWIDKSDFDIIHDASEIREAEIALVLKSDIYEYLESIGWDKEKLRMKDDKIRNEGDTNFGNVYQNGCKFAYSEYLSEKPINILLTRYTYRHMKHTINKKIQC